MKFKDLFSRYIWISAAVIIGLSVLLASLDINMTRGFPAYFLLLLIGWLFLLWIKRIVPISQKLFNLALVAAGPQRNLRLGVYLSNLHSPFRRNSIVFAIEIQESSRKDPLIL